MTLEELKEAHESAAASLAEAEATDEANRVAWNTSQALVRDARVRMEDAKEALIASVIDE